MGKKAMSTPGAPGAAMTRRSPLGPTNGEGSINMGVDDVSSSDVKGGALRAARSGSAAGTDGSIFGMKTSRGRTATNASAQFRITATQTPYAEPPHAGTLAGGKLLPAVMGQKQNFYGDGSMYGPMG